jgi:hypothetical protein
MAIDENFILFILPAVIVVLAAMAALPSKGRIEMDPSTAFKRGKRALVNGATGFAILMGLILALVGGTQNVKAVVDGVNMIQIGGISLLAMGVVLIIATIQIRRLIKAAGRGTHEEVLDVAAFGAMSSAEDVEVDWPERNLPPRPRPQPRLQPPPQPRPPPGRSGDEGRVRKPPQPPRRIPREGPPPRDEPPLRRRPPPG